MNKSNDTTVHCDTPDLNSATFDNVSVVLYSLIIVASLVGNLLIFLVVYYNKTMQTVTNILICNCSFADLLITLLPNVWKIFDTLKFHGRWPVELPSYMCVVLFISVYLSVASNIITLMVISLDRFYSIVWPHKRRLTVGMLYIVVPLIWTVSFGFALPVTFIQKVEYFPDYGLACIEKWPAPFSNVHSKKHYTLVLVSCLYAFPVCLMTIVYSLIAKKLYQASSGITTNSSANAVDDKLLKTPNKTKTIVTISKEFRSSFFSRLPAKSSSSSEEDKYRVSVNVSCNGGTLQPKLNKCFKSNKSKSELVTSTKSREQRTKRVINMLVCIVAAFTISWLPVNLIQVLNFFHPYFIRCQMAMPHWAYSIAFFMQYANSALNPLIYFGFSKTYVKGLGTVRKSLKSVKSRDV